ncbi:uncharacterized protein BDR25DRAFT_360883 [Lindgomyces ingoldianus]|uniref:Uncharacterized protein n=1 Tax=Lindgomyces ingoldianus TaxID=673940 RepID=A0ACB6QGI5_9PLEO|nr:uncharacterized protein BDR25DRAFT_360883 [Lindgomyces ingoldianus]KAF2465246.1 hypothetical protein BDR25DRAFT_360883 [Lindgomyces ingoldianus]
MSDAHLNRLHLIQTSHNLSLQISFTTYAILALTFKTFNHALILKSTFTSILSIKYSHSTHDTQRDNYDYSTIVFYADWVKSQNGEQPNAVAIGNVFTSHIQTGTGNSPDDL